jgi:hypothetical protein
MRRAARIAACLALAVPLAGCGSDSDFGKLGGVLWQNLSSIGGEGAPIARAQAAALPFASIGLRYGSSQEAMLVLATKNGSESEWLAGTQVSVTTRAGRIVSTVGLPHNLSGVHGPIPDTGPEAAPGAYHYLYDYAERRVFGIVVECTQQDVGPERIEIIGAAHDTRRILETCQAPQLDWNFKNEFWNDASTGAVLKSEQNIHPAADTVTIEVLRPEQ